MRVIFVMVMHGPFWFCWVYWDTVLYLMVICKCYSMVFCGNVGGSGRLVAAGLPVDVGAVVPIVVAQCSLSVGIFLSGKV